MRTGEQDIKLSLKENGNYDIDIDGNDFAGIKGFESAIVVSLFSDARPVSSIVAKPENRRGWIGSISQDGVQFGSTLWTIDQGRLTQSIMNYAQTLVLESLAWMLDTSLARNISVDVEKDGNLLYIFLTFTYSDDTVKRYRVRWIETEF